jgi:RecB family endonuclease NucS
MVQIRVMHSDSDKVTEVLDLLLPLLRSCSALVVGDEEELGMRGSGRRVVVEVRRARPGEVGEVVLERVYDVVGRPSRRQIGRGRRRDS